MAQLGGAPGGNPRSRKTSVRFDLRLHALPAPIWGSHGWLKREEEAEESLGKIMANALLGSGNASCGNWTVVD